MASAPERLKTALLESFNPLRLLKTKEGIVPAMGHIFDEELRCNRCGCEWVAHRQEPRECHAEGSNPLVA